MNGFLRWVLYEATPFLSLDARMGGSSATRRAVCFVLDAAVRLAWWMIVLAVVAAVAWKVLAPLP